MSFQAAEELHLILSPEVVLPNAEDAPSPRLQQTVDLPVPGPVALDLRFPEGRAGLRPDYVPGAAVPEAAVDKHRGLALRMMVRQLFRSGESHPNRSRIEGLVWGVDC